MPQVEQPGRLAQQAMIGQQHHEQFHWQQQNFLPQHFGLEATAASAVAGREQQNSVVTQNHGTGTSSSKSFVLVFSSNNKVKVD